MDKYQHRGPARFRPGRFDIGRFEGPNRYGEEDVRPAGFEDEHGMRIWSEDIRSEASHEKDFTGVGPKGYKRPDERIREAVCERLTFNHAIDASEFEVTVSEGIVTLEGSAKSREEKKLAEELVEDLPGVVNVHNHLTVRKRTEDWISHMIKGLQ